jgi:hypothetical protein
MAVIMVLPQGSRVLIDACCLGEFEETDGGDALLDAVEAVVGNGLEGGSETIVEEEEEADADAGEDDEKGLEAV